MSNAAGTQKDIQRRLLSCLEPDGAYLRSVIRLPLAPGFAGGIGLPYGTGATPGWIDILPVIGVAHEETESTLVRILGRKQSSWATWSHPLYSLAPDVPRDWAFEPPIEQGHVDLLCEIIRVKAKPILLASSSLEAIRDHLRAGHGQGIEWRLPIVLALLGDTDKALSTAHATLAAGRSGTLWWDTYREFVDRFAGWLDQRRRVADSPR